MPTYHPGWVGQMQLLEQRFRKYGLTTADYGRMRDRQHNKCAICKRHADHAWHLVVDHDHVTGKVRDLLCSACNKSIGMMRDDAERLRSAADYLDRHGSKPKGFEGQPLPDATKLHGGKRCKRCGFGKKPDQLRAGLCRRCRRRQRNERRAATADPDVALEQAMAHNYEQEWWDDGCDAYYWLADDDEDDGPDSLDLAESGELEVEHNSWYTVPPCMCDTCDDCLERQRNAKFPWVPRLPDGRMTR